MCFLRPAVYLVSFRWSKRGEFPYQSIALVKELGSFLVCASQDEMPSRSSLACLFFKGECVIIFASVLELVSYLIYIFIASITIVSLCLSYIYRGKWQLLACLFLSSACSKPAGEIAQLLYRAAFNSFEWVCQELLSESSVSKLGTSLWLMGPVL